MTVAVVQFGGSNCDRDTVRALDPDEALAIAADIDSLEADSRVFD